MDFLKKLFPLSWKYTADVSNLIIGIIIYVVAGLVGGAVIWLGSSIAGALGLLGTLVIDIPLKLLGGLIDVYCTAGIVIQILVFTKVIKD